MTEVKTTEETESKIESVEHSAAGPGCKASDATSEITIHPEIKFLSELKPGYIVEIHYLDKTERFNVYGVNYTPHNPIKIWLLYKGEYVGRDRSHLRYLVAEAETNHVSTDRVSLMLNGGPAKLIAESIRIFLVDTGEKDIITQAHGQN